ncbi:MAG: hypothetical protein ABIJ47_07275 [Candidatus Bathyarchaeota archaeon]
MTRKSTIKRVSSRIVTLRRIIRVDTQRMRERTLSSLEDMFELAIMIAKGEIKSQTVKDKQVPISLKQRQMWARVAAYIAQIMNSIAEGFDEKTIDASLAELERMVDEVKAKAEAGKTEKGLGRSADPGP